MKKNMQNKNYISSERPNLFEPNVYISMVVTFSGTVSQKELEQAVKTAYAHNEATMSKIVLEESGEAYYETMEQSGCKVFFEQRVWKELLKESEKQPFDLKNGELIRTYIIHKKEEITLFLMAHHLVGDGKSMLVLISDIVNDLSCKTLRYKPMVLINQNYLAKKSKLPIGVRMFVNKVNKKWKRKGESFTWEEYDSVHKTYWKNHSSEITIQTYNADELKSACPDGVTLNSYLLAKLLKKFPESKVIGIPVSIREDNGAMSNQTSGVAITYDYNPKVSLEENAELIQKKLHKQLKNKTIKYFVLLLMAHLEPTLIDSVLLYTHNSYQNALSQKMADIMGYTGMNRRDLGITNLMKIDIPSEQERFKIKDIIFIPPKVSYSKQVVGIATYGEHLHIVYHLMNET